MKPWMAILIVLATLALGLWLMAPKGGSSGGKVISGTPSNEKIATITKGDRVEIEAHLQEGRFTVVEFTADW